MLGLRKNFLIESLLQHTQTNVRKRDISQDFEGFTKKNVTISTSFLFKFRRHTGKNLHRCEICSKIFTTRSKRLRHMPTHDNDGRTFECYLCLFRFDHFYSLRIHYKMKHLMTKRDEIHCSVCDKVFFSQTALNRHMKIVSPLIAFT